MLSSNIFLNFMWSPIEYLSQKKLQRMTFSNLQVLIIFTIHSLKSLGTSVICSSMNEMHQILGNMGLSALPSSLIQSNSNSNFNFRKYGIICIAIYRMIPDEESGIRNGNVRVRNSLLKVGSFPLILVRVRIPF